MPGSSANPAGFTPPQHFGGNNSVATSGWQYLARLRWQQFGGNIWQGYRWQQGLRRRRVVFAPRRLVSRRSLRKTTTSVR